MPDTWSKLFATYEASIEAECVPLADAPLAVNDRVVFTGQPQYGAMTVTDVIQHETGGWQILYTGEHGVSGSCPDWRLTRAPEGFTPPPAGLTRIELTEGGNGRLAGELARAEVYERIAGEAFPLWRDQMALWLKKWGNR